MNATDALSVLGRTTLEASVLVLIVLAVQALFHRYLTPHWRCALWLLVIVRLVPFSIGSAVSIFNFLPSWSPGRTAIVPAPPAPAPLILSPVTTQPDAGSPAAPFLGGADQGSIRPNSAELVPDAAPVDPPTRWRSANWSLRTALFWVWVTGCAALLGHIAFSALIAARRFARLKPLEDSAALELLRACGEQLGVRRVPIVSECDDITTPALHGFFQPRLLLPPGFTARFSPDEQRFVFLHELAHMKRRDLPLNWIATLLQVLHWFNPVVWFGLSRWRVDREIACDALALDAAGPDHNRDYGRTMLRLLENFTVRAPQAGLVGILESKRQLHRRLEMIAGYAPARRRAGAVALVSLLAVVGLTDAQVNVPPAPPPSEAAVVASAANPQIASTPARDQAGLVFTPATRDPGKISAPDKTPFSIPFPLPNTAPASFGPVRISTGTLTFGRGSIDFRGNAIDGPLNPDDRAKARLAGAGPFGQLGPKLPGENVLILVSISESMLTGETNATAPDMFGRSQAITKSNRVRGALTEVIMALDPGTRFLIYFFDDLATPLIPARARAEEWFTAGPDWERAVFKVQFAFGSQNGPPRRESNLEHAFAAIRSLFTPPDSIVLLTDGLPTTSDSLPGKGAIDEAQRTRFFEIAAKQLPPRTPVTTILFPSDDGLHSTPALFWELANATRGALITPPLSWWTKPPGVEPRSNYLAFVVDTSGSMRDPNTDRLWPIVIRQIDEVLDRERAVDGIMLLDADGRSIPVPDSTGAGNWLPNTPAGRAAIEDALARYQANSSSNPLPGVQRAVRSLLEPKIGRTKLGVYILGDEFAAADSAEAVLKSLDALNPADENGRRKVAINAIGFPTTIRYNFSMNNTGVRFADLMRTIVERHGGAFIALPDL